jgi:hypothetical protein
MSKWVTKALEPGSSSLQILLRHRLSKLRPVSPGTWPTLLQWAMVHKFSVPRGSRIWNRLIKSWKLMSKLIEAVPPRNADEVLQVNI